MAIYSGKDMPKEVGRTTMDFEVEEWLKDCPVLGSHEPIHVQRAAHDRFIDTDKPPIGRVEQLGLEGPHGTIPARCYHPSKSEEDEFVVRWLHEHSQERGIDPARIALGGDSAGGNQTCVVALKLRDEGGPKLALQMPIYPEAALPFNTRAGIENRSGSYVDTAGVLLFAWS